MQATIMSQRRALTSEFVKPINLQDLAEENWTCRICALTYGTGDTDEDIEFPIQLPCQHVFGEKCIRKWLGENMDVGHSSNTCPIRRAQIRIHSRSSVRLQPVSQSMNGAFLEEWIDQITAAASAANGEPDPPSMAESRDWINGWSQPVRHWTKQMKLSK